MSIAVVLPKDGGGGGGSGGGGIIVPDDIYFQGNNIYFNISRLAS